MVWRAGSYAARAREPRQVREEATVVGAFGAADVHDAGTGVALHADDALVGDPVYGRHRDAVAGPDMERQAARRAAAREPVAPRHTGDVAGRPGRPAVALPAGRYSQRSSGSRARR